MWPGRVTELCAAWKVASTERERNRILSELWFLLNAGLIYYIRSHAGSYGHVDPEDARDIAAEKAMVFLRNLESEPAQPANPARICAYISTLARNGLVDTLRKQGRNRDLEQKLGGAPASSQARVPASAEVYIQHSQFLEAITGCMQGMTPRARSAWFLRVFLDLPSKKIASHPDVRMSSTGVDMLLSRTRRALRDCMRAKGFDATDAPVGTFVALWEILRGSSSGGQRSNEDP